MAGKLRTIITQDAEVDDQNSLRHFLLYANEVELQGIVQTSSKFHWVGVPGAVRPQRKASEFEFGGTETKAPFDQPYRWPGTDWMFRVIDDYEKDYPNLKKHAEGFPEPDYLRSITKVGNIGYEGEMEQPTEGSELIREKILDDDPRTLYLQVWGGTNTIARALRDIQEAYQDSEEWPALHKKITEKIVITACGEQDPTYREYIAENWPGIQFVKTLQMGSYAYPWFLMPEGESKDTLRAAFMKSEILNGKSALAGGYCTWLDGNYYEGEGDPGQFGTNKKLAETPPPWMGGGDKPQPLDFLSEGDSPTFFLLFDWGFRTLEDFSFGGIAGRYEKVKDQYNSKGEALNVWDVAKDAYTDREGNVTVTESMWPYVADIQRSFAARVDWCAAASFEEAEHAPRLSVREGVDITAAPGEQVTLHAKAEPSGRPAEELRAEAVTSEKPAEELRTEAEEKDPGVRREDTAVSWRIYSEASASCAKDIALKEEQEGVSLIIPENAKTGDRIHVIVKAQAAGKHKLTYYQQVIITVN